jgi:putative ABC transport system permease protein
MLLSFLALLVALVLVESFLPTFNQLAGKQIKADFFANGLSMAVLLGVALLVGLLAGSYPAFVLSALRPALVLKSASPRNARVAWIRQGLVVFQFAISVALIAGTLIVQDQLGFVLNRQLGFDKEQVLVVKRAHALGQQRDTFKEKLLQNPSIISAATSTTLPGKLFGRSTYRSLEAPPREFLWHARSTLMRTSSRVRINLASGRNFSRDFAMDSSAILLNETAAKSLAGKIRSANN